MAIFEKLLEIRTSVDYIQKTEQGSQGNKYVDSAVLLKKIRDKMNELGVILTPSLINSSVETIPQPTKNTPNAMGFLFKSDATYTFIDCKSGEKHEVPWFITGKHGQDPAMAGGSALTYFERYFLLKFFQIPTAKDDPEFFQQKTKEPEPPKTVLIGEENLAWAIDFCKRHGIASKKDKKAFQDHYKFDSFKTTQEQFIGIKAKILEDYNEA